MSFLITYTDKPSEVLDDVKGFNTINGLVVVFTDGSELYLNNTIGITPYFYNEG
jgi:hypothetical protein